MWAQFRVHEGSTSKDAESEKVHACGCTFSLSASLCWLVLLLNRNISKIYEKLNKAAAPCTVACSLCLYLSSPLPLVLRDVDAWYSRLVVASLSL